MIFEDTIAAISTPLGEGGLAVLRVSGPQAVEIADRCFLPAGRGALRLAEAPTHTLHYGRLHRQGQVVDEVLAAVMRAPRTYTREDVVEFSCHGGLLTARLALETLLAAGARLAQPGEFTRRAFLNGRLDLTQAEAVADVIHARTELALAAAQEQLSGKLAQRIRQLRQDLLHTLAHIEAHLDFPEEDIAPDSREQLCARLEAAQQFMQELLRTAREGRLLRQGIRAAIVGRPNVGKSSLLNLLLGHDRAIVSSVAGTTRDTIEETANIRGLPVVFVDTAGLRDTADVIEAEGVRRSQEALRRAELVLQVLDVSEPLTAVDQQYLDALSGRPRVVVCNKSDLPACWTLPQDFPSPVVAVSCATGEGLEALKDAIKGLLWAGEVRAEMLEVMINARHQDALRRALEAAENARRALQENASLECVALDLRIAVNTVGEITGQTATEDLLDVIFSQFCIGK
jgi:tRNA modification GTPase